MAIPFTFRELKKANLLTYNGWKTAKTNAHRLLLFYSIECGLKAVYLKRNRIDIFDSSTVPTKMLSHNINHILEELRVNNALFLERHFELPSIKKNGRIIVRKYESCDLNQAWRYGGELIDPENDEKFEKRLCKISDWIRGELK